MTRPVPRFWPAVLFAALLVAGLVERFGLPASSVDPRRWTGQALLVQRELFLLVGAAGLMWMLAARVGGDRIRRRLAELGRNLPGLILGTLLFMGVGEVAVRVLFWGGIPFSGGGPIVEDFEKNFALNRFDFEGRSRGPDYLGGEELPPGPRILIQGDSITWGAGIASERDLFSWRLRELLRIDYPGTEVATLAFSGREIDGHLRALEHYGETLQPDVIVYQWYINDLELDASLRPRRHRLWRRSDILRVLVTHSYFWFFIDNRLDALLPGPATGYPEYILRTFGEDTAAWNAFRDEFVAWAERAKGLTPHVVVLLYPAVNDVSGFWPARVHARVSELAERQGLTVIDFIERCGRWEDDYGRMYASPFDRHPNEDVHEAMAEVLRDVVTPMLLGWSARRDAR